MSRKETYAIVDKRRRTYQIIGTVLACCVYLFMLAPSMIVIPVSFGSRYEMQFPPTAFSTELYSILFSSNAWIQPLILSLKVAVATTILALIVAVPAAYGVVRFNFWGKKALLALVMSPLVIPSVVFALGVYLYFSAFGLTDSMLGLITAHTMFVLPYALIINAAGIQKLDPNLEFSALLMGAGRLRMLLTVVLPQLYPTIIAAGLFAFLISFDEVVISWFLAGPSTTTLPVRMFNSIRWEISPVIAAVATLLTAISFTVCMIAMALQKSDKP